MINKDMIAYCGAYCEVCEWKDKIGCKGCKANQGNMFWGECDKAKCCIEKGFNHCGECSNLPCKKLKELFDDSEHGDKGVRLRNLINWKNEVYTYEELNNKAQEQAKNLNTKDDIK